MVLGKNIQQSMPSLTLLKILEKKLDEGNIGCIFVNLQKAFDTVEHDILLSKLEHYGIRGLANDGFKSDLSNKNNMFQLMVMILILLM